MTKVKSESPQQADIYKTNTVKTGGKWIDGKDIYRTIFEYTLTTAVSSSATKIQTAKSITFTTLIKSKCFAISSSKYMYTVPYINSIGNSISLDVISSGNDISLINNTDDYGLPQLVTGAFKLLRADEDSNFKDWNELFKFKLNNEAPKSGKTIFRDFTF